MQATLGAIFDDANGSDNQCAGAAQLEVAIELLKQRCGLDCADFEADDDMRLLVFLGKATAAPESGVSREQFVACVQPLLCALQHLGEAGLTLKQLKALLTSVFEQFDSNGDGIVCLGEFRQGLLQLGIEVDLEDSACLYNFLASRDIMNRMSLKTELSAEEKLASIVKGALGMLQERFQWASVINLAKGLETLFEAKHSCPWSCLQHMASEMSERIEDLGNAADAFTDFTGLVLGLQCLAEALGGGAGEPLDPTKVAPIALFTGDFLAKVNKDLRELVPQCMSEDRALLYWGLFHKYGFSQASFCALMACGTWSVTEAGEVLSANEDSSLSIVVKGSAAVRTTNGPVEAPELQLPPFATIGETSFMRGGRLWEREVVVASEPVVTISWDFDSLREVLGLDLEAATCLDGLLSHSMIANFQLAAQSRRHAAGCCEATAPGDLRGYTSMRDLTNAFAAMDSDGDGQISKEELAQSMESLPCLMLKAGFVPSRTELNHLFGFFDIQKRGCVTLAEFKERLLDMEDTIARLQASGMTLDDVRAILQRSHSRVDTDGDGCISFGELHTMMRKLHVGLNEQQCATLHAYFESTGSGAEAQEQDAFVLSALEKSVNWQAKKKGLPRLSHLLRKVQLAALREEDSVEKFQKVFEVVCHSAEDLCAAGNVALDAVGGVASVGSLLQLRGVADADDIGKSMLLLSLSVFPVLRRHWADRHAADLQEHEAHLYRKTFEKAGFTITDFQKLLRHGNPRWQRLSTGTTVDLGVLQTVVSGCCSVYDEGLGLFTGVGNGHFLCSPDLDSHAATSSKLPAHALEPTSVVTWDWESLRVYLKQQPALRVKLQRAIAISKAECLLETSASGGA